MNDKIFCKRTYKRVYRERGHIYHLTATAEIHSLSGQEPYLSITGELYRQTNGRGRPAMESCGMLHDDIEKHIPQLRQYLKWHLMSTSAPMHYVSNSLYWAGLQGWTDGKPSSPPNYEYLLSTSIWGAVETDSKINLRWYMGRGNKNNIFNRIKAYFLAKIMTNRREALRQAFYNAMCEIFQREDVDEAFQFESN